MSGVVPGRGLYTEEARQRRLGWLRDRTGLPLAVAGRTSLDAQALTGNIENFTGSVEIPVGLAGPLLFTGDTAVGEIVAPLATTEGALIASAGRGARAVSESGGVVTRVLSQRMARAPVFEFDGIARAVDFTAWVQEHREDLETQVRLVSRHARLVELDPYQIGRFLHLRVVFETADAAGQNMTTAATWQICRWIESTLRDDDRLRPVATMLEGNMSSDKKVSAVSMLAGRGTRVTAECRLTAEVVRSVLKCEPETVLRRHHAALLGGQQAGMTGYGVNAANIIAALFVATGQDIASVHESGASILSLEPDGSGLRATILLPNLVIGTVGGGTVLPHQREWLTVLGCAGEGGLRRFAEIVAGFALALDLSTIAAMAGGQFADAHRRLGRARAVEWLLAADLNAELLQPPMAERAGDPALVVQSVRLGTQLRGEGIASELGELGERRKLTGLHPMRVRWRPGTGTGTTTDLVAKVKPRGDEVISGIGMITSLCGPELAQAWQRWGARSDFAGTHRRELAVYRRDEPELTRLLPRAYGIIEDDRREAYVILMERFATPGGSWDAARIDRALRAIGAVHGRWLGCDEQVLAEGWLHRETGTRTLVEARELWEALARYNAAELPALAGGERHKAVLEMAASVDFWESELAAMPQTVVHNDFNPRNVVVPGERVIAYDWELATIDVPQRDVAELLAFTLGPQATAAQVEHHLRVHREAVAAASSEAAALVAATDWHQGYRLALQKAILTRFQLYATAHVHRELAFLPALLTSAFHLWEIA
ncbi:phosphotransferase [Actinoplanes sp. TFC3]|uniref:phosphotransferase n=1 Tax=Actinoplanes sp. TFC3 TaxID=1710355 RepID=UPI0008321096|nr:phosphotransferase [Actinoplanes sp. TFC3]